MTVLPGSLDYLYYNGILDHIPYEAYEQTPVMNSGMGGNPYRNLKQSVDGGFVNEVSSQSGMNNIGMSTYSGAGMNMNGSAYLDSAMQGNAYSSYNMNDSFVKRNPNDYTVGQDSSIVKNAFSLNGGVGQDYDFERNALGEEGKSFRETLVSAAAKTRDSYKSTSTVVKGLISGGIMLGTLALILLGRGKGRAKSAVKPSFWSKLNPCNWFKKSI